MINEVAGDVVAHTTQAIEAAAPSSIDDIRTCTRPLAGMSDSMRREHVQLKRFLHERVYRHHRVIRMTSKAQRVVTALFDAFMGDPRLMPLEYAQSVTAAHSVQGEAGQARIVADYIAGMTDRYAILEHRRLFDPSERT
jgi:dGTPase